MCLKNTDNHHPDLNSSYQGNFLKKAMNALQIFKK